MTNAEYNERLFSLIHRNAEWPYKNVPTFDFETGAKSLGIWCKALMDTYQALRRKGADTKLEAAGAGFYDYDAFKQNPAVSAALADSGEVMRYPLRPGVTDTTSYEQLASVIKAELKEFLERAHDASLADQDRSLLRFLLTCVDRPTPAARDPLEDF